MGAPLSPLRFPRGLKLSNGTQNHVGIFFLFCIFGRTRHLSPYFVIEPLDALPLSIQPAAIG